MVSTATKTSDEGEEMINVRVSGRGTGLAYDHTTDDGVAHYVFVVREVPVLSVTVSLADGVINVGLYGQSESFATNGRAKMIIDSGSGLKRPAGWSINDFVWERRAELIAQAVGLVPVPEAKPFDPDQPSLFADNDDDGEESDEWDEPDDDDDDESVDQA
jgi:hypothetical protein